MTTSQVIVLVASILIFQAAIWFLILRWMRGRSRRLVEEVHEQGRALGTGFIIGPESALYRGADAVYGRVKGNGVICLTDQALMFEKLAGRKIKISRDDITAATVQKTFRGNLSFLTGGNHLVVRTRDNNRIGFLVKNAERWVEALGY